MVLEGRVQEIASRDVVPGDVVVLTSGTKVPADLRLFRVQDLNVDGSALTGEPLPVTKSIDPYRAGQSRVGRSVQYGVLRYYCNARARVGLRGRYGSKDGTRSYSHCHT